MAFTCFGFGGLMNGSRERRAHTIPTVAPGRSAKPVTAPAARSGSGLAADSPATRSGGGRVELSLRGLPSAVPPGRPGHHVGPSTAGERLRRLREEQGLTQSQLAGDRLTKAFISQIETGRSRPSLATVEYLAERLGVSVVALAPDYAADQEREYLFRATAASISGHRVEEAESLLTQLQPLIDSPRERARAARLRAELSEATGLVEEALTQALTAYDRAVAAADHEETARSCNVVVRLHFLAGRFPAALAYNQRSIAAAAHPNVPAALRALVLNNGGQIHFALGDSRNALDHFRRAGEAAEAAEDLKQLGYAALGAGEAARRTGDVITAIAEAERAQVLFERLEMRRQQARVHLNLADVYVDLGEHDRAREHAERARDAAPGVGDGPVRALALERLAHLAALQARCTDAMDLAQQAVEAAREADDSSFLALALAALGEACACTGDVEASDRHFDESLALLEQPGTSQEMSPAMTRRQVLLRRGTVLRARGDLASAVDCLERAARLLG